MSAVVPIGIMLAVWLVISLSVRYSQQPGPFRDLTRQLLKYWRAGTSRPGWPTPNDSTDSEWKIVDPAPPDSPSLPSSPNPLPPIPHGIIWAGYLILSLLAIAAAGLILLFLMQR